MYQQSGVNAMPGLGPTYISTPRPIWLSRVGVQYLPGGAIIDGAQSRDPFNAAGEVIPNDPAGTGTGITISGVTAPTYTNVLECGTLMGKITSTPVTGTAADIGKYAPSILGQLTATYTNASGSFTVSAQCAAEIVRRVGSSGTNTLTIIGPPTDNGTVVSDTVTFSAVNTTTGVVSCSTIGANFWKGSVICAADGSQNPISFIDVEEGVRVTDGNGNSVDVQYHHMPIAGGVINSANIVAYSTMDAQTTGVSTLQAYFKNLLKSQGNTSAATAGTFMFSDDY